MHKLLKDTCENETDLDFVWNSLVREHVVAVDAGQKTYIFHSYNKLPQGSCVSCIIINNLNKLAIEKATIKIYNDIKLPDYLLHIN